MKKIIFGFCTLIMCVLAVSCSDSKEDKDENTDSDFKSAIQRLAKDINKNGNDWSVDEWVDAMKDINEKALSFWEGMPGKEEIDDMEDALDDFRDAISGLDKKAEKKFYKALKDKELSRLIDKVNKVAKKARKKADKDDD